MNYNKAEFYTSFGKFSQIPKSDRLEFAFSGRSNVGKSSLINKLLNRKNLARVSSMPGKTVTINFFSVENIYIVDLPGYGYASVSKSEKRQWGSLIGGYLDDGSRQLALVFQLIDMRYEKKSTILTTNMNFNEWDGIFYDAVVANAIMDRVLHHAHVIPISGKSYRLKDHLKQTD